MTRRPVRRKARSLAAGATQASLMGSSAGGLERGMQKGVGTKRCGPGQTRRLTGTALGRVIVTGGLIKRRRNLGPLCYVAVTAEVIHRRTEPVEKPVAIAFPGRARAWTRF